MKYTFTFREGTLDVVFPVMVQDQLHRDGLGRLTLVYSGFLLGCEPMFDAPVSEALESVAVEARLNVPLEYVGDCFDQADDDRVNCFASSTHVYLLTDVTDVNVHDTQAHAFDAIDTRLKIIYAKIREHGKDYDS